VSKNNVVFKGKNDGILIILNNKISFEELKVSLEQKVSKARHFFRGANVPITFKGRSLSDAEEMELLDIISESSDINIPFVHSEDDKLSFFKRRKISEIDAVNKNIFTAFENMASFHRGSVRSGQSLRFKGSIIVIGDVNPGGEIIAEGNVIVLGAVKGLVHAGCAGLSDCFIIGLNLCSAQLRIADIITFFPSEKSKAKYVPRLAFAKNGEIFVEPLNIK